jgi:hypothetical protein
MSDLTDRYVSATLRSIPERQRNDIEAELRTSIGDAVDARVENGEDPALAEELVLTGLGDPDRLAASYAGSPGYLIGPELFFDYKRLLIVLLVTVVPIITAILAILQILSEGTVGSVVSGAVGAALNLAVHIVFWTTLVFVIIERTGGSAEVVHDWKLSDLPARPTVARIGIFETLGSIAFIVLFIGALFFQREVSPFTDSAGDPVPFLNPALWSSWIWYFIGVLVLEIVFEIVKYRIGRWTWTLASINLALAVLFVIPALWLLGNDMLVNPEFLSALADEDLNAAGRWITTTVAMTIAIVTAIDVGEGFWKARRTGDLKATVDVIDPVG